MKGKIKRKAFSKDITRKNPSVTSNGIKKQYFKSRDYCRVTFKLPKEAAPTAKRVTVVGEFNDWNLTKNPMQRLKSGDFKLELDLPLQKEYRFRYLIDGCRWENDWHADKYVSNPYGCDDSVVVV